MSTKSASTPKSQKPTAAKVKGSVATSVVEVPRTRRQKSTKYPWPSMVPDSKMPYQEHGSYRAGLGLSANGWARRHNPDLHFSTHRWYDGDPMDPKSKVQGTLVYCWKRSTWKAMKARKSAKA